MKDNINIPNANLTKQHGNIIVSQNAHLISDLQNNRTKVDTDNSNKLLNNDLRINNNIIGQHAIPRYRVNDIQPIRELQRRLSMQENANRSQLEREDSYQKHLKSRLENQFTNHERTLSRLSISIADSNMEHTPRNNMLIDSLDAGIIEDPEVVETVDNNNLSKVDNSNQDLSKPTSATSDYGYGPIVKTPIIDSTLHNAPSKIATPISSGPFTRGGHAWNNDSEITPVPNENQSDLIYMAQQERLYLQQQVKLKKMQLDSIEQDKKHNSAHQRQLDEIAKTFDSHLLATNSDENPVNFHPKLYTDTYPDPKQYPLTERRIARPFEHTNIQKTIVKNADDAAAWQARIANQISPRSLSKNATSISKINFIAKNRDGRRTPKSYKKMAGTRRRPTLTDKDSMSNVQSALSSANTLTSKDNVNPHFNPAHFNGLPSDSGVTRARKWCPQVPQGQDEMWSADVDLGLVADRMYEGDERTRPNAVAGQQFQGQTSYDSSQPLFQGQATYDPRRQPLQGHPTDYQNQISNDSWRNYDYSQHYRTAYNNSDCNTLSTHDPNNEESPNTSGSPYRILPPIGYENEQISYGDRITGATKWRSTGELGRPDQSEAVIHKETPSKDDGYAAQYNMKKDNKKNTYKMYTLGDYKKIRGEIKLGGLGADLENTTKKEKRGKHQKQMDYAKRVQESNAKNLSTTTVGGGSKKLDHSSNIAEDGTMSDQPQITKRQLALQYSQNVQKPKIMQRLKTNEKNTTIVSETIIPLDQNIAELQRRHEQDRLQADLIRRQNSFASNTTNQQTLSSEA